MGVLPQENLEIRSALGAILGLYFIKKVKPNYFFITTLYLQLIFLKKNKLHVHACGGMSEMHPGASVTSKSISRGGTSSNSYKKNISKYVFIKKMNAK